MFDVTGWYRPDQAIVSELVGDLTRGRPAFALLLADPLRNFSQEPGLQSPNQQILSEQRRAEAVVVWGIQVVCLCGSL